MLLVLLFFDYTIHLNPNSTNVFMLLIFVTLKDVQTNKTSNHLIVCFWFRENIISYSTEYKCSYILGGPEMHFVHRGLIFFSDLGFGWIIFFDATHLHSVGRVVSHYCITLHMECSPQWQKAEMHLEEKNNIWDIMGRGLQCNPKIPYNRCALHFAIYFGSI